MRKFVYITGFIFAFGFASTSVRAAMGPPPPEAPNAAGDCKACIEDSKGNQHCYKILCSNLPSPAISGAMTTKVPAEVPPACGTRKLAPNEWCVMPPGRR